MALQPKSEFEIISMTEEDYLTTETDSTMRREYIDGYVYAMVGASTNHIRITGNIFRKFGNHLVNKSCEAFMSNMKIKVIKDYYYPDVVVVCNHTEADGITHSPVIIVEVLSTSTRKRDLTTKLLQYINLPSLQEYVLIEQDIVRIQVLRKNNAWKPEEYSFGDTITLAAIDLSIAVEDIYERVENSEMNAFRKTL